MNFRVEYHEFQGRICYAAKRPLFRSRSGRASDEVARGTGAYRINKTKDFSESLCFALFVLCYFIQVLVSGVSSALQELCTRAR